MPAVLSATRSSLPRWSIVSSASGCESRKQSWQRRNGHKINERVSPNENRDSWLLRLSRMLGPACLPLRKCPHAGRPFGDEEFIAEMEHRFERKWLRKPKTELATAKSA